VERAGDKRSADYISLHGSVGGHPVRPSHTEDHENLGASASESTLIQQTKLIRTHFTISGMHIGRSGAGAGR
jgi:spore coat protein CotH